MTGNRQSLKVMSCAILRCVWRRFEEAVTWRICSSFRQSGEPHVSGSRVSQVRHRTSCFPVPASPSCSCRRRRRHKSLRLHAARTSRHDELRCSTQPPAGRTACSRPRDHTRRPGSDVIARLRVRTTACTCI